MLFCPTRTCSAEGDLLDTHPPPYIPGPYTYTTEEPTTRVPSLVSLCIRALVPFPEQVHQLPVRLILRPHRARALIDDLVPDPAVVDPRLWATLVQVYDSLPRSFASYTIPLADTHLPLLQSIPPSASFSLVTVLELPACDQLTDDTVLQLKFLHALTAFDASETALTAYGVKTLTATLQFEEADDANVPSCRGPWYLRVLSLRGCRRITNDVFSSINKFPLLSALDLRGTLCTHNSTSLFRPSDEDDLFHPTPIRDALATLQSFQINLHSSSNPYTIHINTLYHRPTHHAPKAPTVAPQDAFVVIPSNNSRVSVGITHILDQQIQARDDEIKHARNKQAWYDRQDRMEARGWDVDEQSEESSRRDYLRQKAASDLSSKMTRISAVASAGPTLRASGPKTPSPTNLSLTPNRGLSTSAASTSVGPTRLSSSSSNRNSIPISDALTPAPRPPTTNLTNRLPFSLTPASDRAPAGQGRLSTPAGGTRGDTAALTRAGDTRASDDGGMNSVSARMGALTATATGGLTASTRPMGAASNSANPRANTPPVTPPVPGPTSLAPETRPAPNLRPLLPAAAPASFYQPLPRPPPHPSSSSARLSLTSTSNANRPCPRTKTEWTSQPDRHRHDASLRLFRPPPPFSFLAETLARRREEQREARQHRERNLAAVRGEALARVDRRGAKAEGMRRLEESARREVERRRGGGGWKESTFTQPLVQGQKQASRNPFRKRPSLPVSLPSFASASTSRDPPHPTPVEFALAHPHLSLGGSSSSHTSSKNTTNDKRTPPPSASLMCRDENRPRVRPRASFSFSSRDELENVGSGDGGGRGDPGRSDVDVSQVASDKVLKPISAVQVPVLSADLRKEALKKEKELEKSLKRASSTSSLASGGGGGGSAKKKAKVKTKENVGVKPFDWKGWSSSKGGRFGCNR
ncbi:unnamed protein product [Cyclocybe aegerita]|uniref:Uncharacterized protein n=1 Tax=Cyclocybe aegerita TaxID=1973307 RepID=A0A8S0WDI1_CYCAE|nr:unnamed protein product [Cyclocybe aegerita]